MSQGTRSALSEGGLGYDRYNHVAFHTFLDKTLAVVGVHGFRPTRGLFDELLCENARTWNRLACLLKLKHNPLSCWKSLSNNIILRSTSSVS